MIPTITQDELLNISYETLERVEAFTKNHKLDMRELASLSRHLIREMGRENNMIQDLLMTQTLRQLRESEEVK